LALILRLSSRTHPSSGTRPSGSWQRALRHKRTAALAKANTEANTFAVIADELLAKKMREGLVPTTVQNVQWLLDFPRPALGARPIAAIRRRKSLSCWGVEGRGRHETAKRLRSTIGECFRYAAASGRAETDPTSALKGALTAPQVRHRAALTGPKAFGGLLRAISAYDGSPELRAALQLLALTFVRPGELRAAEWSEFDLENAEWAIPPAR
jgi:integrase